MIKIEYWNGTEWIATGQEFGSEHLCWIALGGDDLNYRTVDENGNVLTCKKDK